MVQKTPRFGFGSTHKRRIFALVLAVLFSVGLLGMRQQITRAQYDPAAAFSPNQAGLLDDPSGEGDGTAYPTKVFATITPAPTSEYQPPLYSMPSAPGQFEHFYLARPIGIDSVNWPLPSYLYGYEDSTSSTPHSGLDFDAPMHTPILAAGPGKIVFAGYGLATGMGNTKDPYGLAVVILHDFSYYGYSVMTIYGHMEKVLVEVGERVNSGDEIGYVGMTGNTSGPHVHFEVRLEQNGDYYIQNPYLWMAPPIDRGVFVGQFMYSDEWYLTNHDVYINSLTTGEGWTIKTYYAQEETNDPYYRENAALGDLPAGTYKVGILNNYQYYEYQFIIEPGTITYVTFKSGVGFTQKVPDSSELTGFTAPASH
jgi:murein DD-endopeptidase MepM/ murein hydrolase activator NlpD